MAERRQLNRRNFSYYMRVMNENTGELVGHLADLSTAGFRLESSKPIPENRDFYLRIDLSTDISSKTYMVFGARSKWCQKDRLDPSLYDVGFQIVNMTPSDFEIFNRMFEKYGSQKSNRDSTADYMWK
jgi:PilZ domain